MMERVRFIGARVLEYCAHVQHTRAQARTQAQTDLGEVIQFSTLHCLKEEGRGKYVSFLICLIIQRLCDMIHVL
jgi:tRNA1(Val) A37 N6-methylase TrmN6